MLLGVELRRWIAIRPHGNSVFLRQTGYMAARSAVGRLRYRKKTIGGVCNAVAPPHGRCARLLVVRGGA